MSVILMGHSFRLIFPAHIDGKGNVVTYYATSSARHAFIATTVPETDTFLVATGMLVPSSWQ